MASRVISILFVALLVSAAIASGSSREDMTVRERRSRLRCKRDIRRAEKQLKCAIRRISLPRRLSRARRCRYAGLSYSEYKETRAVCKERSESLTRVRAARKKCRLAGISVRSGSYGDDEEEEDDEDVDVSGIKCDDYDELLRLRKKAVRACEKIGWVGGNARDAKCEKIKKVKWMLYELRDTKCGEDGVEEAERNLKKVKRKCRDQLGGVSPVASNRPRSRR